MTIKLDVPYRSQWASDADFRNGDCGPTCVAMILNYRGKDMTPDEVYKHIKYMEDDPKRLTGFTSFNQLMAAAETNTVRLTYKKYADRDEALRNLRANLDAGNPAIALVKYLPWKAELGNDFDFGHFVVVTGYDDDHILMHDPLFGKWVKPAEVGAHFQMRYDLFTAGWGTASQDQNSNWSCVYSGHVVDVTTSPVPPQPPLPQPVPTPAPVTPTPTPKPPAPTTPAKTMDDVNRRIRALAAYRWAVAPDFNNPASMQVWLDNLGDFGLEYEEYVVKSGDSLSALAARHYGSQNRWPAIKAYNDLQRDGLWLGETIMVPRLGQSGAHLNPALPSDTADFSKDIEFMLIDPAAAPLDYNELVGESSKGIGFVDLPDA